jgi:O-antigen ligase
LNLPQPWFERLERTLLVILAGFLFWGNAVSSITLLLLIVVGFLREGRAFFRLPKQGLWMLLPVGIVLVLWGRAGFAASGSAEIQLWATWLAALFYFHSCRFKTWFKNSFIVLSALQAFVVITFLYGTSGASMSELGSSQFVRDLVGTRFGIHPTYMSAVWLWAALMAVRSKENVVVNGLAALFLIIGGSATGGKMPILAFLTILPVFIFLRSKVRHTGRLIGLTVLGFIVATILSGPVILQRFQEIQHIERNYSDDHWLTSTELRLGVWECTLSSIGDHIWTGVGIGHTRHVLDACYATYENDQFFETEFNTHNQFAHYLLAGGLFLGAVFILWWLGLMIFLFRSTMKSNGAWFMLYMTILLITENYLLRQHGMMFFAFMLLVHFPFEPQQSSPLQPSAN